MGGRVPGWVASRLMGSGRHVSSLRGKCCIVRSPSGFYFKVSTILLSNFTGMGGNRATLSLKAKAKVVPVLLGAGAGKGRFANLRVRGRYMSVTKHDIECGRLRSSIRVMRNSVGRTTSVFKTTSFSMIADGPPCVVKRRKLHGPSVPGTVTERRMLYGLRSIIDRTSGILGRHKEFCVIREPFELTRVVGILAGCHLRPGEVRLMCPCVSERPGVILVRTLGKKGSEIAIRPPLVMCGRPKICARGVLGVCSVVWPGFVYGMV